MAEFNITGWLDPALKYFADQAGIPVSDYSAQVGGEGIGVALECIADLFTKGWFNKAIQFVTGLVATGYAVWGRDVNIRLRRELLALGTHELLRVVDPKPSDIIEARESLSKFISAVSRGDWNGALAAILRTPDELRNMFKMLGLAEEMAPVEAVTPVPTPAPAPAPEEELAAPVAVEIRPGMERIY
jgi:hypothetical protein